MDARTGEGDVSLVRFLLVYDRPNLSLLRCDRMEDDATALKEYTLACSRSQAASCDFSVRARGCAIPK